MLKTYFFIPANNQRFISKSVTLPADYIIYDLEDSIKASEESESLENLKNVEIKNNYYIRPRLFTDDSEKLSVELIDKLIHIGFKRFIVSKFYSLKQLAILKEYFNGRPDYNYEEFLFILLVEHPAGLQCLKEAITGNFINIDALGLGNHDYCNVMGMKHTIENLYFARQLILNTAKANNLGAIDIVTLDLNNDQKFCDEALNGFSMGFEGKFLIHPRHLELVKQIKYYSDSEVEDAKAVYPMILELMQSKTSIIKLHGKIYEKPHINRILNIINWSNQYGNK
jgi:citrate lyase beta subunit